MQGPDLVNSLMSVLLRFRKNAIALGADIEAMFYQVRVDPKDKDSLRFLWWPNGDLSKEPNPHRMTVHLLGATSSPCCATFSLRQAAIDFHSIIDSSDVVSAVQNNFYVDDFLSNVHDGKSVQKLINDIKFLLDKAGFRLTKWMSNSETINKSLPEDDRSKSLMIQTSDGKRSERVLGVYWNTETDVFYFTICMPWKPRTKRGMLATMNLMFDPLGL